VALRFYGTPTAWKIIAERNNISGFILNGGETAGHTAGAAPVSRPERYWSRRPHSERCSSASSSAPSVGRVRANGADLICVDNY